MAPIIRGLRKAVHIFPASLFLFLNRDELEVTQLHPSPESAIVEVDVPHDGG